ncbi:hypothetical protein LTR10_009488 [Elasticomyces elasticus]|nr:hypothetical protein LTR10_009488 [Elasticomyces elasticus]KAK4971414.1 hypothetical protein LTR42_007142 [Elasticomyces elasticus]
MAEDEDRPRKVRRLASSKPKLGRMVTVSVGTGDKARDFYLHEDPIIEHSDFFKAALAGNRWQEGTERKVLLPEDEPEEFEGFQCFVYSGLTFLLNHPDGECSSIVHAWSFADKLQSCSYKDALTDSLALKVATSAKTPVGMQYGIADGSSVSAGLTRLLVDLAICYWTIGAFEKLDLEAAPKTFVRKLLAGLAEDRTRTNEDKPWLNEDCHYHDHGEEKPCYKTMFTY